MANIKVPFSSESISTGSILSSAPISAFNQGDGTQAIARGLQGLGQGILMNRKLTIAAEEKEKQRKDEIWLNQSLSNYTRGLTDFEVEPTNQARTDYLPAFLDKADQDASSLVESAPSPEAAAAFREKARGHVDSRYGRSADKSANNELAADINVLESTWGQSLSSYHQLAATDAGGAGSNLVDDYANSVESISNLYGDVSPELTRKMIGKRTEDIAMALADKNPEQAKNIVENSPWLDESSRQALLNKVEAKKTEVSLILKEDFNTAREKAVVASQKEGIKTNIPIEDYRAVYEGEQADVMKRRDDLLMDSYVSAHEFVGTTKGELPAIKQQKATEYEKTLDTEDKLRAFANVVQPALVRDQKLFETDNVQWLTENNEQVHALAKEIKALEESGANTGIDGGPGVLPDKDGNAGPTVADPSLSAATREQYYNAILKYQGYPGEGDEPTRFMNKPPDMRALLTKTQANYYANQINKGSIDDVIGTIGGILDQFPNDDLRSRVISDLTTLPQEKIKPEYQVAFQNANQSWLPDYLGAVKSAGELPEMNVIDNAKIKATLASDPVWASFIRSTNGPQGQRSKELAGYFNAVETYAKAKIASGATPKVAVQQALDQLLTSTMKPVNVYAHAKGMWPFTNSNQELWLPREFNGKVHSDEELLDYGRRMGMAFTDINPWDVDPSQFPTYSALADSKKGMQSIYAQIEKTAQYYPAPGGTSYYLTIAGENGERINLRNREGKLFQLSLDTLPDFRLDNGQPDNINQRRGMTGRKMKGGWYETGKFWNFTR
jgi:hypothetical protein